MSSAALRSLLAGRGVTQPWTQVSLGDPRSTPSRPATASSCALSLAALSLAALSLPALSSAAVPLVGTRSLAGGALLGAATVPGGLWSPTGAGGGFSATRASLGWLGPEPEAAGGGPDAPSGFSGA